MSYFDEYVPVSQRGVVFLSSVPRDMRPPEVCLHFNKFGTIQRHRFVPFPKKERRPGGPLLPLQYKEGWLEFSKAEDAKAAAAYMNTQPVDCKRTRKCYGQLWNAKYLADFSWDTLQDEREGERRARRMAEVDARRQERDANEAYRRLVAQAHQQRKQRRSTRTAGAAEEAEGVVEARLGKEDNVTNRRPRREDNAAPVGSTKLKKARKESVPSKAATSKSIMKKAKQKVVIKDD